MTLLCPPSEPQISNQFVQREAGRKSEEWMVLWTFTFLIEPHLRAHPVLHAFPLNPPSNTESVSPKLDLTGRGAIKRKNEQVNRFGLQFIWAGILNVTVLGLWRLLTLEEEVCSLLYLVICGTLENPLNPLPPAYPVSQISQCGFMVSSWDVRADWDLTGSHSKTPSFYRNTQELGPRKGKSHTQSHTGSSWTKRALWFSFLSL